MKKIDDDFRMRKMIERIQHDWINPFYHTGNDKKVFYSINELCGWRFYLKAIQNRDWKSIKRYIGF
jgi:hypothetical protein